jgi:Phage portal protein, SPP1 Gp6-like
MSTPFATDTTITIATNVTTLPAESTSNIKWALGQFHDKRLAYEVARNYYDGKQRLAFASEKLNSAFGRLFKAFSDNLMPTVVETVKDRLKLDGFTVAGKEEGQADAAIQPTLDELWRRNRLLVRANQVHLDSLIEGDSYVIIWPNRYENDFPTFYPNCASAIVIDYDDEQPGYITRAAKAYEARDKHWRLTLYFRDRIEKYVTQNTSEGLPDRPSAFVRLIDADPWPIPNPYDKVPVFHFANRASIGQPGCSELREAMPLQDALNKSIADMLVASEFYGVPQRWVTGLEDENVIKQAQERFKLMSGGLWGVSEKDAKFGEFSAADISKFITVSETFRKEIARVSRTPLHYFALEGEFPSGESLRVSEGPLIRKVKDRQETWGAVWGDAFRFALQVNGNGDFEPQPKWLNPETRDDDGEVNRAALKVSQLQIPYEQVWREMGYTEKQIGAFSVERAKRQKEQMEMMRLKSGGVSAPVSSKANGDSEVVQ